MDPLPPLVLAMSIMIKINVTEVSLEMMGGYEPSPKWMGFLDLSFEEHGRDKDCADVWQW